MACKSSDSYYKKEFTEAEKSELAERLLSGLGYRYYYQGSVGEQLLLAEAESYNNKHAEVWREHGIPYLKRGIASGYLPNYDKCVFYDSLGWQGYRGYCTLYFYRDYQRALQDFDQLDRLTPNFTDYPQATSIDYMRGICYLGLGQAQKALGYLDKHIETERQATGYAYIPPAAYIAKAMAHKELNQLDDMQEILELGTQYDTLSPDMDFYLAQLFYEKGDPQKAMKRLLKAKEGFAKGYGNSRPYVEEFYQVYWADITDLEKSLTKRSDPIKKPED